VVSISKGEAIRFFLLTFFISTPEPLRGGWFPLSSDKRAESFARGKIIIVFYFSTALTTSPISLGRD
jgi:hypothetical protein